VQPAFKLTVLGREETEGPQQSKLPTEPGVHLQISCQEPLELFEHCLADCGLWTMD